MSRLKKIIEETYEQKMLEADEEAPLEDVDSKPGEGEEPVEGSETEEKTPTSEEETEEETEEEAEPEETGMVVPEDEDEGVENFDDVDKTIESMVGITEIQHTTSSSILDFEDGGQIMYVQPMVSIKSETLNKIIELIISDVKEAYSSQKDEITGKSLNKTKYWKSIDTLISTMVKSQLTKSDNVDGLIDEIKQIFKILEVK